MLSIGSKITAKKALLLLIFFGVLFLQIKLHISLNQKVLSETNTSFVINKGENLYSVLAKLEDKYDLHSTWWIRFNYIFKEAPVIKTGRYNILPNYSIKDLIKPLKMVTYSNLNLQSLKAQLPKITSRNSKKLLLRKKLVNLWIQYWRDCS